MNIFRRFKEKAERRRQEAKDLSNGGKTYMMDATWERAEELRVDRLGPSPDDVVDPERVRVERWRPRRTLGPYR